MKLTLILTVIFCGYVVSALPVLESDGVPAPSRFLSYLDEDGVKHTIDLEAQPDYKLLNAIERDPADNIYLLFTRENPSNPQTLVMNNAATIVSSNFRADRPTVVIAHGWLSNQNTGINAVLRDALLGNTNCNVIVLDWGRLATSDYVTASFGVPTVGIGLGRFLAFLNTVTDAPYSSMHLVGFSLGAHLVGNAGKELDGKIARITGLDPSGPLWTTNSNRLDASHAVYVEGIHTDGPSGINPNSGLGIGIPIGTSDFFPNGGNSQPGCLTSICDHNRSWELFGATITYNHLVGRECTSVLQVLLNTCRGANLHMGNDIIPKTGSGIYRLETDRRYPY